MPHVGWPVRNIEWHGAGENLLDDAIYGLLARDSLRQLVATCPPRAPLPRRRPCSCTDVRIG